MVCPIGYAILEYPCLGATLVFHTTLRIFNLHFGATKQVAGANIRRNLSLHLDAPPNPDPRLMLAGWTVFATCKT